MAWLGDASGNNHSAAGTGLKPSPSSGGNRTWRPAARHRAGADLSAIIPRPRHRRAGPAGGRGLGHRGGRVQRDDGGAAGVVPGDGLRLGGLVEWETGTELDNLGFHLYRGLSMDGPWERLTTDLIPGLGSSPEGKRYSLPRLGPPQRGDVLLPARGLRPARAG